MSRVPYFRRVEKPSSVVNGEMLSAEKAGVDGPGARTNDGQRAREHCQQDGHQGVSGAQQGDPRFEHGDEGSDDRGPKSYEEK